MITEHDKAINHIIKCDECRQIVVDMIASILTARAGSAKSAKKAESSRLNGMKGGRPKK